MPLRKALAYSKKKNRPYTRKSRVKAKAYIKTVPDQKVVKLKMGAINDYEAGKFNIVMRLITTENIMIRDNALEASRQYVHKILDAQFPGQYYFAVRTFPHHILRENRVLTGAGADRLQTGMSHSFGTAMGRAAIMKAGHDIFLIAVSNEKARRAVVQALQKIKAKLPCHTRLITEIRK